MQDLFCIIGAALKSGGHCLLANITRSSKVGIVAMQQCAEAHGLRLVAGEPTETGQVAVFTFRKS